MTPLAEMSAKKPSPNQIKQKNLQGLWFSWIIWTQNTSLSSMKTRGKHTNSGHNSFSQQAVWLLPRSVPACGSLLSPTLRPRIWLMAALSFNVHSATTFALISFIYNINALRGFFMCGFFFSSSFLESWCFLKGKDTTDKNLTVRTLVNLLN